MKKEKLEEEGCPFAMEYDDDNNGLSEDEAMELAVKRSLAAGKAKKVSSEDEEGSVASDWSGDDNDDGSDGDERDEEDEDDESLSMSAAGLPPPRFCSYDKRGLVARQLENIKRATDVMGCNRAVARRVLKMYKWNTQEALGQWMRDPDRVARSIGLANASAILDQCGDGMLEDSGSGDCSICFDDAPLLCLRCNHGFCKACWLDQVVTLVKSQKALVVPCLASGCPHVLEDAAVASLLKDSDKALYRIYTQQVMDSFVSENPMFAFCPSPGCELVVELIEENHANNEAVKCREGHSFCFRCKGEAHEPAPCHYRNFISRFEKDGDVSDKVAKSMSRPCPSCGVNISKISGCNHITCFSCQFHFCWLCSGKFGSGPKGGSDGYGSHKCDLWNAKELKDQDATDDEFRFGWFGERYQVSIRGVTSMREIAKQYGDFIDEYAFIEKVVDVLCEARHTLGLAYICAFYRPNIGKGTATMGKDLFEFRTQELCRDIEMLASKSEEVLRNEKKTANAILKEMLRNKIELLSLCTMVQKSQRALCEVAYEELPSGESSRDKQNSNNIKTKTHMSGKNINVRVRR